MFLPFFSLTSLIFGGSLDIFHLDNKSTKLMAKNSGFSRAFVFLLKICCHDRFNVETDVDSAKPSLHMLQHQTNMSPVDQVSHHRTQLYLLLGSWVWSELGAKINGGFFTRH